MLWNSQKRKIPDGLPRFDVVICASPFWAKDMNYDRVVTTLLDFRHHLGGPIMLPTMDEISLVDNKVNLFTRMRNGSESDDSSTTTTLIPHRVLPSSATVKNFEAALASLRKDVMKDDTLKRHWETDHWTLKPAMVPGRGTACKHFDQKMPKDVHAKSMIQHIVTNKHRFNMWVLEPFIDLYPSQSHRPPAIPVIPYEVIESSANRKEIKDALDSIEDAMSQEGFLKEHRHWKPNHWVLKPAKASGCKDGFKHFEPSNRASLCTGIMQHMEEHKQRYTTWLLQPYIDMLPSSEYKLYFTGDTEPMVVYTSLRPEPEPNSKSTNKSGGTFTVFIKKGCFFNEKISTKGYSAYDASNTDNDTPEAPELYEKLTSFGKDVLARLKTHECMHPGLFDQVFARIDVVCLFPLLPEDPSKKNKKDDSQDLNYDMETPHFYLNEVDHMPGASLMVDFFNPGRYDNMTGSLLDHHPRIEVTSIHHDTPEGHPFFRAWPLNLQRYLLRCLLPDHHYKNIKWGVKTGEKEDERESSHSNSHHRNGSKKRSREGDSRRTGHNDGQGKGANKKKLRRDNNDGGGDSRASRKSNGKGPLKMRPGSGGGKDVYTFSGSDDDGGRASCSRGGGGRASRNSNGKMGLLNDDGDGEEDDNEDEDEDEEEDDDEDEEEDYGGRASNSGGGRASQNTDGKRRLADEFEEENDEEEDYGGGASNSGGGKPVETNGRIEPNLNLVVAGSIFRELLSGGGADEGAMIQTIARFLQGMTSSAIVDTLEKRGGLNITDTRHSALFVKVMAACKTQEGS